MTTKTVWFLDVDGVINAFPVGKAKRDYKYGTATPFYTDGSLDVGVPTYPIHFDETLLGRMRDLHERGDVEIVWLTTWGAGANHSLRRLVGLPELRVAGDIEEEEFRGSQTWWKVLAMQRFLEENEVDRYVWTDDDIKFYLGDDEVDTVSELPGLTICTNDNTGLTHDELDKIEAFLGG